MSDESVELDFTYLNSLSHKSECVSVDFHSEDSLLIANFHFHSFAICNLRNYFKNNVINHRKTHDWYLQEN